jgi:toxin ParE1/3/4
VRVVYAPQARRDIDGIAGYIARGNSNRAVSFIAELREKAQSLRDWPERFPVMPRFARQGFRRCHYGRYIIMYRVDPGKISVLRVFHTAQDYESELSTKA